MPLGSQPLIGRDLLLIHQSGPMNNTALYGPDEYGFIWASKLSFLLLLYPGPTCFPSIKEPSGLYPVAASCCTTRTVCWNA